MSLHQSCIPLSTVDCYCNPCIAFSMVDCNFTLPAKMSSNQWSTGLERKHIHMICEAICMEENNTLHTMIVTSSDVDNSSL